MSYTIALCLMLVAGESTVGDALASTRRSVFRAGFGTGAAVLTSSAPPATAAPATTIADRLSMPVLQQPGVKQPSLFGGQASLYADLFFPTWMQGEWQATSTLTGFEAPLGPKFLAGPSGSRLDVAEATIRQQQSKIGSSIGPYPLKWLSIHPPFSNSADSKKTYVVEDRAFNTKSRLNAFAGRTVARRVEYVDIGRTTQEAFGDVPLPTTLTTYRSVLQKVFSNNRAQELVLPSSGGSPLTAAAATAALGDGKATPRDAVWTGFETTRTLFARTDRPDAPYVVADSEVITQLRLADSSSSSSSVDGGPQEELVIGRVRLADYLSPNDALFFDAKKRAVSVSDYELRLTRPPPA